MSRIATLLAAASMLTVAASSANAAFVLTSSLTPLPPLPGTATPVTLQGITVPSTTTITTAAYQVTFTKTHSGEGVVQGTNGALHAVPVAAAGPMYLSGDFGSALTSSIAKSGKYLSTGAGAPASHISIAFATPQTGLELLWGSVDASNELQVYDGSTLVDTVFGTNVLALPIGNRGFGGSVYVQLNDMGATFDRVVESSGVISFESAALVASTVPIGGVPEPVSLALLGSGLLAVGAVRRIRR